MASSRLKSHISSSPFLSVILFSIISFFLGIFIFWIFLGTSYVGAHFAPQSLRFSESNYPLINSLLLCNVDQKDFNQDKKLSTLIAGFIQNRIHQGLIENMSVYLINYANGRWAGVNENERYDPASLLKVPLMIAYFKNAETNPGILSEETSFSGDNQNDGEYFRSSEDIVSGKMYPVGSLIRSMIENSDNTAATLLELYADKSSLYDVYTDLGLPVPSEAPNVEYISVKNYAYFFRILYNGTYLDKKYSEQALEYLTQSKVSGIREGVPAGTVVAQKFGERAAADSSGKVVDREFHDCGIVYKPGSPYLLCVMSRGQDFDQLKQNISDLSKLIYENINK